MRRPESYENNFPATGRIQKKDALQRPFSDIQNKVKNFLKYIPCGMIRQSSLIVGLKRSLEI